MLGQAAPNPFTITTTIGFTLPRAGRADIVVFDVSGRTIKHLFGGDLPAGSHTAIWDGTDDHGSKVGSGVFFYRLKGPGIEGSKRMVRVSTLGG
jgi:flagellar hook assembly protein FlgD